MKVAGQHEQRCKRWMVRGLTDEPIRRGGRDLGEGGVHARVGEGGEHRVDL